MGSRTFQRVELLEPLLLVPTRTSGDRTSSIPGGPLLTEGSYPLTLADMTHQASGAGRLEKWDTAWILNEASRKEFQGRPEVRVEAGSGLGSGCGTGWGERGSLGGGHKPSGLMSCVKF